MQIRGGASRVHGGRGFPGVITIIIAIITACLSPLHPDEETDDGIVRAWEQKSFLHPSICACVHIGKLSKSVSHRWCKALFALRLHGIPETQSSLLWVRRGAMRCDATRCDATRRDATRCNAGASYESEKPGPLTSPRGATPLSEESALGKHADAPWESFFGLESHSGSILRSASGERPPPIADARVDRDAAARSYIVNHTDLSLPWWVIRKISQRVTTMIDFHVTSR